MGADKTMGKLFEKGIEIHLALYHEYLCADRHGMFHAYCLHVCDVRCIIHVVPQTRPILHHVTRNKYRLKMHVIFAEVHLLNAAWLSGQLECQ